MVQLAMLFALLVWPFLSSSSSLVGNANTAGLFFLPAVSLVMLTGWVGQVSLAQASFVGVAACAFAPFALLNVRDTKMGRALFALRGSEIAAASFGIDVVRAKLTAFALSGFVAGLAGSLLIVHQGAVVSDQFNLSQSLFYLSVAVVGGLTSVGGAAAAAILFAGLDQLFFQVDAFAGYLDVASAVLLAAV